MAARPIASPAAAPTAASRPGNRRLPRRRGSGLGYLGYAVVLVLAGAGAALGASRPPDATSDASAAAGSGFGSDSVTLAGRGADLFVTSCASCHGPKAAGTSVAPDIRSSGAALVDLVLRTGRMPLADPTLPQRRGPVAFSDEDIQALVAYVSSLGSGPGIPNVVVDGSEATRGRDLFTTNCAACHGPSGGGGSVGGGFVAPGLGLADPTTIGEAVVGGPGPMPRFSFSPEELNQLAAYVTYLRDAPNPGGASGPAVGPVTEGFIAGLTLLAILLVARWVGVRRGAPE